MRPLSYRELVWDISLGPSSHGQVLTQFESEQQLLDATRKETWGRGTTIELQGLLGRTDLSTPRWTRRMVPAEEATRVGRQLWDALPPHARDALAQHDAGAPLLRLKITSEIPGVADLPWEWLSDGVEPPFALRPNVRLVRVVPIRFPVSSLSVDPPLKVLLMVPNPKDERYLNGDYEIAAVNEGLAASNYSVSVLNEPSFEALARALSEGMPHILHYIGHGGLTQGDGNLILQDADGSSHWVGAADLAKIFPPSVRLFCLSTPFTVDNYQVLGLSHLARAISLAPLPTTVTNQYPVSEKTVRTFWARFYNELMARDGNVNDAVHEGRADSWRADQADAGWASFSLVVRDQTGVSFDLGRARSDPNHRRSAELAAQFSAQLANDLASQVQTFGSDAPQGLRDQYEAEEKRATGLIGDLAEEA